MTRGGWTRRAGAVRGLVDRARGLLLRGDFEGLAALTPRTEAALAALSAVDPGSTPGAGETLKQIADAAERNRRLLEAAIDGVAQARAGLKRAATRRDRLGYDRGGAELSARPAPEKERRV